MSALTIETSPRQRPFGLLVLNEMRLARRYPIGMIVAIGIPLVLLVIFGSIPKTTEPSQALGGISFFNLYVPTLLVFVLLALGVGTVPAQLATYRHQGVLRRMSTTPVSPARLLAAQMTVALMLATMGITTLLGLGGAVFHLAMPRDVGGDLAVLGTLVLTAAAMLGLGLCVAALAGSPGALQAYTALLFYPLAFFSGLYVPLSTIHSPVVTVLSKMLPTGAGFNALHAAFTGGSPSVESMLALAGWAVASCVVAARLFRWE